ncbi:MAG: FecCD family ABC transporter permease [Promethearchaeota archaeon]
MFKKLLPIFLIIFLIISIVFAISIGPVEIEFRTAWAIILNQIGLKLPKIWSDSEQSIILNIRLPRVLMAVVVGAMLGVAGVAAQGLFRNPIVDPYLIGISSAGGFGTALIIVLGISLLSFFTIPLVSFLFAMLAITIIYELSKTNLRLSINSLLLAGLAISFFFSALTSFILYYSEDKSHLILSYLMGSFWGATWLEFYVILAVMVPGTILLYFYARDLNLMVFGDDSAQTMGVNIEQSKKMILFLMVILSSTAVAFCGTIGFVGLIIPHIIRLIAGSDNRRLIPLSALAGGLLLLWADVLARILVSPREMPVGIFTALMGGPFFIYLIIKKKKMGELG